MHYRRSKLMNELPQQPSDHHASTRKKRILPVLERMWRTASPQLQAMAIVLVIAIAALFLFTSSSPDENKGMHQIARQVIKLIRESELKFSEQEPSELWSRYQESLLEPLENLNDYNNDPVHKAIRWMARSDTQAVSLQRYALIVFYFATGGDSSWESCSHRSASCREAHKVRLLTADSGECDWFGVTCDEDGEVTRVAWTENGLTMAEWPMELLLLDLELLWLSGNPGVTASLPTWISQFSELRCLALHDTQLHGTLPHEIYRLTELASLRLYNTNLSGTLATDIGKLTELTWLWIHGNQLTGNLPTELGLLTELTGLTVHQNEFDNGQILPSEVCELQEYELEELWTDCLDETTDGPTCTCCTKCFMNSS